MEKKEAKKGSKRVFHERCGGAACTLKNNCFLHLIPRDFAVNNVIKTQVRKAGDECGFYRNSTVSEVMQEIRILKEQNKEFDYLQN